MDKEELDDDSAAVSGAKKMNQNGEDTLIEEDSDLMSYSRNEVAVEPIDKRKSTTTNVNKTAAHTEKDAEMLQSVLSMYAASFKIKTSLTDRDSDILLSFMDTILKSVNHQ